MWHVLCLQLDFGDRNFDLITAGEDDLQVTTYPEYSKLAMDFLDFEMISPWLSYGFLAASFVALWKKLCDLASNRRFRGVRLRWMRRIVALAALYGGNHRLILICLDESSKWGKLRLTKEVLSTIQPWSQCNWSDYSIRPQDDRPWNHGSQTKLEPNFQLFKLKYNPSTWQNTSFFS